MKRTFDQLVPGDFVYRFYPGETNYSKEKVIEVTTEIVKYGRYDYLKRFPGLERTGQAVDNVYWFSNEIDAIRFAKAQLFKELHFKIKTAKKSIQAVKDFRKDNYDKLNLDWTDREINKLERNLGY